MSKKGINCKSGLSKEQELEAREIRKKLLNETARESVYCELRKLFAEFNYETTFDSFLKTVNPPLYSACERVNIQFSIIDRNLIINM